MMRQVEITENFTGYPDDKARRRFLAGETPNLAEAYADMLVEKGLAKDVPAKAEPAAKTLKVKED